jgi:hypothetical protein
VLGVDDEIALADLRRVGDEGVGAALLARGAYKPPPLCPSCEITGSIQDLTR